MSKNKIRYDDKVNFKWKLKPMTDIEQMIFTSRFKATSRESFKVCRQRSP